jgi:hypothetical protein
MLRPVSPGPFAFRRPPIRPTFHASAMAALHRPYSRRAGRSREKTPWTLLQQYPALPPAEAPPARPPAALLFLADPSPWQSRFYSLARFSRAHSNANSEHTGRLHYLRAPMIFDNHSSIRSIPFTPGLSETVLCSAPVHPMQRRVYLVTLRNEGVGLICLGSPEGPAFS